MTETPQKQKTGFFRILGLSCGVPMMGCFGLFIALFVVVAAFAILSSKGQEAATKKALDANAGRGALEAPIPAGEWITFKGGRVRATRIMRPADAEVRRMNMFNSKAATGAEFVLVWFEVDCQQAKCNPAVDLDLRLIDATGKAWGEPWLLVLDNDLDNQEALSGHTIEGWQGFEYPERAPIQAVRVKWGAETLHVEAPGS